MHLARERAHFMGTLSIFSEKREPIIKAHKKGDSNLDAASSPIAQVFFLFNFGSIGCLQ